MKELDDFAAWMRTLNRSEHTIRGYRSDLAALFVFLGHERPAQVKAVDLERFLTDRVDRTAASTRARHTHAFRAFFAWWSRRSRRRSPAEGLETPRLEERLPRALSEREYRTVRDVVRDDVRLAAVVEIILQTGLRVGELVRLAPQDFTRSTRHTLAHLVVRQGKGRKDRLVPLNSTAERALRAYLKDRPKNAAGDALFTSRTGQPLTDRGIRYQLARAYKLAGVKGASVRTLRHTFFTHHAARGTSLVVLKEVGGHKRLTTTQKYLQVVRELMEDQLEGNGL